MLRRSPFHHSYPHRHFVREAGKTHLRLLLGNAAQLEQDRAFLYHRHPVIGLAFAGAHAGFQRTGGDRLVWENADVQPALAADVLLRGNTARLDGRRFDPPALGGLKSEIAEDDAVAPMGLTFYTSSLAFSVLHSLGHQRHQRLLPCAYLD